MAAIKYYKCLNDEGYSCNGGRGKWSLPEAGSPGAWMPRIKGKLVPCERGYHICTRDNLAMWLRDSIYECEFRGEIIKQRGKCVVREVRLLRRIETWDKQMARLFAADCAEHVLAIYEREFPNDLRPRNAIKSARQHAHGLIGDEELTAADEAARAAMNREGDTAVRAAVAQYRRATAYQAAAVAAWAAVEQARLAGPGVAAHEGMRAAAWSAVDPAGSKAARALERRWQTTRLWQYLDGDVDMDAMKKVADG